MKSTFLFITLAMVVTMVSIFVLLARGSDSFWIIPINTSGCSIQTITLQSDAFSISFNENQISKARRISHDEPQLVVPMVSDTEFLLTVSYHDCESLTVSSGLVESGTGYYLYLEDKNIWLRKRI